jgi:cytochrome bd-type quinol oxidase subunit 2
MNFALVGFLSAALAVLLGFRFLFAGIAEEIKGEARAHARYYALSYVKCFALVSIAMGACFTETFWNLTPEDAAAYAWWNWVILFWKPIAAGLATLLAFLDRSGQTATAKKEKDATASKPPFASAAIS